MKTKREILMMLSYLDNKRKEAVNDNCLSLALAIGSQIQLIKWIMDIKDED